MQKKVAMKNLAIILFLVGCLNSLASSYSTEGCGKTKTCYRNPENCDATQPDCRFVSWRPAAQESKYKFEMSGGTGNGERYISIALALISDMKDADMYYCDGNNFGVGAIQVRRMDPTYLAIGSEITDYTATTVDGVAQCEFTRSASIDRDISEGAHHEFDIENHKYFLLVAVGDMDGTNLTLHDWRVHLHDSFDFSVDPTSAGTSQRSNLISIFTGILIAALTGQKLISV